MESHGGMILIGDLYQCHFVHHKSQTIDPGANHGLRGERPATNHLSHARAYDKPPSGQPVSGPNTKHDVRLVLFKVKTVGNVQFMFVKTTNSEFQALCSCHWHYAI
jgi:hypothetical protein